MKISIILMIVVLLLGMYSVTAENTFVPPLKATTSNTQFQQTTNVNNTIVINITNNITNNITQTNFITNNFTNIINITNNITNNVTNLLINNITINNTVFVENNITNNISNNFYSAWLTIDNNVTVYNNVTTYVDNNITINITNNVTTIVTTYNNMTVENNLNVSFYSNCSANFTAVIINTTNIFNYTTLYNDTYILSQLDLKLNITDKRYNDTLYCNGLVTNLSNNLTIYYAELYENTTITRTLTTANVYYNLTNYTTGEMNGFYVVYNATNTYIVCNRSGLYAITYNMVASSNSANQHNYRLLINNVVDSKSQVMNVYTTNNIMTLNFVYFKRLNIGDTIQLQVANTELSGKVLTQYNRNILVHSVG